MIAFRRAHPVLSKSQFYSETEIRWLGAREGLPNWANPQERQLACLIPENDQRSLCLMFNASNEDVDILLPLKQPQARWHIAVDTAQKEPHDLFAAGEEPLLEEPRVYRLGAHSSAILLLQGTTRQIGRTALEKAA
jgi:glycogen operon protein